MIVDQLSAVEMNKLAGFKFIAEFWSFNFVAFPVGFNPNHLGIMELCACRPPCCGTI
jgi:hypothetical protein